jgi:hypothetical protein
MVLRREVHGAISICSFPPSVPPYPWLRLHLGDVGTPPRQTVSVASTQTEALDGRSEASTWITDKRTVLPLRPRAGIHRPHRRVMVILSEDLVAHIYMLPSGIASAPRLAAHPRLVRNMANTMDRKLQARRGLNLCLGRLGALEGAKCKVLSRHNRACAESAQFEARAKNLGGLLQ